MLNKEMLNKFLVFEVDETYAIELDKVMEIIELPAVTKVPETPPYIAGVINVRSHVIPLMDVRTRFKKEPSFDTNRKCVVTIEFEGEPLGIIVDKVVDLITIDPDSISTPPQVGGSYAHVFIKSIGIYNSEMTLILDCDKLINLEDIEFMNEIKE